MSWSVETLNPAVDKELEELSNDFRARFVRITRLIEEHGLPNVGEPHVKRVRGPIWEIRIRGKAGSARALYVTRKPQRVVIVRAFLKKTNKTPANALKVAADRARELDE